MTLLKLFEQKIFLSNCSKQLVTPVNLTRKKFHELFNFQDWERAPKAKKLPFIEVISAIVQRLREQKINIPLNAVVIFHEIKELRNDFVSMTRYRNQGEPRTIQLLLQFASVINDYGRILKYNFKFSVFNYVCIKSTLLSLTYSQVSIKRAARSTTYVCS